MHSEKIATIIQAVSNTTKVPVADILSTKRTVNDGTVLARFMVYSILRDVYKLTYQQIADNTNRNRHNTIIYALRKVEQSEEGYQKFIQLRESILDNINF